MSRCEIDEFSGLIFVGFVNLFHIFWDFFCGKTGKFHTWFSTVCGKKNAILLKNPKKYSKYREFFQLIVEKCVGNVEKTSFVFPHEPVENEINGKIRFPTIFGYIPMSDFV